ncbi:HAMP domain-containing sensor histidine kinase [Streptomyces sp. 549]|nr:HAMP domain-containing sensor histidine kinase [Streptomyces sp. 549]MDK1472744.1 HAMP domain-containing sensor histidine kinase [Streptomyces sp. 549]
MPTLRGTLTLSSIAMVTLGIVVATCVSVGGIWHYLMSNIDNDLTAGRESVQRSGLSVEQAAALAAVADLGRPDGPADPHSITGHQTVVALLDDEGRARDVRGREPHDAQMALADAVDDPRALLASDEPHDVEAGGVHYRATAVRLADGELVLMATSTQSVHAVVRKVVKLELVAGILLITGLGFATFHGSRRRLRPLEDMVETASAIAEGSPDGSSLSRRVAGREGKAVCEVEQLRTALNAMLHQVEAAFLTREHAAEQLRRFVADASHELRTPLSAIRGYLQLYERGMITEPAEQRRALSRMTAETERMARLVDELLALARIDQGPQLRPRPVDLPALVREAAADLSAQQPGRPVELDLPGGGEGPVSLAVPAVVDAGEGAGEGAGEAGGPAAGDGLVLADEPVLRQVVANLLANVRVHTPPEAAVRLHVARSGEQVVLRVADDGPGMDPRDAERIFDRFFRTGATEGSGLGMAIVRAGADALGGEVSVTTAPGAGLAVTVRLPAADAAGADPDVPGTPAARQQAQAGGRETDPVDAREVAQACLEASSTTVMSASAPTRTGGPQAPAPRVT